MPALYLGDVDRHAGISPSPFVHPSSNILEAHRVVLSVLSLTAVSVGLNILLAATGWMYSTGILLTVLGVVMLCVGVKQFWKNMRGPRKPRVTEARIVRRNTNDSRGDVNDR